MTKAPARKVRVAPWTPAHQDDVALLYAEVFGERAARNFAARWRWFQDENPVEEDAPKLVLLDGTQVVGFVATVTQRYRFDRRPLIAHATSDYMVAPKHRFHGIALMKECLSQCENSISLEDMEATIGVLKYLKFSRLSVVERHVKVLDGRVSTERLPLTRYVPQPAWNLLRHGIALVDRVRMPAGTTRIEALAEFDERFDRFFERTSGRVSLERDAAYLRWRYGPSSPQSKRRIAVALSADGELRGYAVSCLSADNERTGHILELHAEREGGDALLTDLLANAVQTLRDEGAWLARVHRFAGGAISTRVLQSLGFDKRAATHTLLAKLNSAAELALAKDAANWSFTYGDTESSYGTVLQV